MNQCMMYTYTCHDHAIAHHQIHAHHSTCPRDDGLQQGQQQQVGLQFITEQMSMMVYVSIGSEL